MEKERNKKRRTAFCFQHFVKNISSPNPSRCLIFPDGRSIYFFSATGAGMLVFQISRWSFRFIAMEYVEGQTLDARIAAKPPEIAEIIDIGMQIADALDEAHQKGVTHRDVKPAKNGAGSRLCSSSGIIPRSMKSSGENLQVLASRLS